MRTNLFGELSVEPSDIAEVVAKEFQKQYGIRFEPNTNKTTGFHYWNDTKFPRTKGPTVYCVYKDGIPQYVGQTTNNDGLRIRLGRLCCELQGKTKFAGNHPGAKKLKKLYDKDYTGLTVKYYEIPRKFLTIQDNHISLQQVELELIRMLRPICNQEIYKTNWIAESRLELS
jgi:hypothetical protein